MNGMRKTLQGLTFGVVIFLAANLMVQERVAEIIFLNLVWKKGDIVLEDYVIRAGRAKPNKPLRIRQDAVVYESFSERNTKIGDGLFPNPSIERLEYSDPEKPEQIKVVLTKRDTTTFTLRLPYTPDLARVDFFMLKDSVKKLPTRQGQELATLKGAKIASVSLKSATRR